MQGDGARYADTRVVDVRTIHLDSHDHPIAYEGPANQPMLLVVAAGEATVGRRRRPVAVGEAIDVDIGDVIELRAGSDDVEVIEIRFAP
jgi:hypothetical protein